MGGGEPDGRLAGEGNSCLLNIGKMPCAKFNALSTEPHLILQVALRGRYSDPCKYSRHAGGGVGAKSRLLIPTNPPQPRSNSSARRLRDLACLR